MDEQTDAATREAIDHFTQRQATFNDLVVGFPIPAKPQLMSSQRAMFRSRFMQEELQEFRSAQIEGDLDGCVDAVIDLIYVACGTLNEMGVVARPSYDEVHKANMLKKRGSLSKRGASEGYDAVKPEGWKAPSHADYLSITSEDVQTILAMRHGRAKLAPTRDPSFSVAIPPKLIARPNHLPKLLVLGHARHGKDTVCELLRDKYGFRFTSSSLFCAEHIVMPSFKEAGITYPSVQACFEDRVNRRQDWYDAISGYNEVDKARLARAIYAGHDVYCGMRSLREFEATKAAGLFDVCIWVDARGRGIPIEGPESCTVTPDCADHLLDNDGTLADLERNLSVLMSTIYRKHL